MKLRKGIEVGSLLSVRNSLDPNCWLGLVVDQEAGKKWVARDPCLDYEPSENRQDFLLVRVLGLKWTELLPKIGKRSLPIEEPHETEVVRWAFVQLTQAFVVAGPDAASIEMFLEHCSVCDSLGMTGGTFFRDVNLLVEYLQGVKRTRSQMSYPESKFFKMLEDVLPRQ
ncbi:MAG: hypothetical protein A2878_02755 [Candidatus Moranbacteria bacterium RIFCSPHIGHO2_01_FULL_54_31]|nr:MAG: hypothetical protein A2878_02755 [Candidatus Moranbacteria bacterium RIFCSPHIGHO2_01_FULL_54_31]